MSDKNSLIQTSYVVCEKIEANDQFKNNAELPLLIYKGALLLHPEEKEETIEDLFSKNGYNSTWQGDLYAHDHAHDDRHEVLAVFSGHADIVFGGEHGKCQEVNRGDVIIIPAGVAHRKSKSSDNFKVIGAYPQIGDLSIPSSDPVYGIADGHLHTYWSKEKAVKN